MTLTECLEKWETGKHEYISYHDTKYYVNVYGFLFEYKTDLEFVVSNKAWLLSNEWRLVEKKVIPRGFNKNRDCSFYKPCLVEVWVNVYWNKETNNQFTISYYTEGTSKEAAKIYKDTFIKTLYLSQMYNISYDSIKDK